MAVSVPTENGPAFNRLFFKVLKAFHSCDGQTKQGGQDSQDRSTRIDRSGLPHQDFFWCMEVMEQGGRVSQGPSRKGGKSETYFGYLIPKIGSVLLSLLMMESDGPGPRPAALSGRAGRRRLKLIITLPRCCWVRARRGAARCNGGWRGDGAGQ